MGAYHGKGGVVYRSTSAAGNAVNVVFLTEWTLDKATDKVETTVFNDANKTYVQGLADVKGTLAGYFDNTTDQLFDAAESSDGVKIYLYPSVLVPTVYHYGPAWVDASINVGVDRAVTLSANFVANGAWGRKP